MADQPLSQIVLYARREGGTAYGLRYVCDDVPEPLRAVVIHLDAKAIDPPGELRIGINALDPPARVAEPLSAAGDDGRVKKLEAEIGALRERLLVKAAQIQRLERRLRAFSADPEMLAFARRNAELREAEREATNAERAGQRSIDRRYLKKRRK